MIARLYSGEDRVDRIDPRDRGLAYGDGVFETIRIHRGEPVWWTEHFQRLTRGCEILGIGAPGAGFLRSEIEELLADCAHGVLKAIVTRGIGERGYAPPTGAPPTLLLTLAAAPPPPPPGGSRLRWCATPLAIQPRLAGIKHLNRLEQVLARAEWNDPGIHEGLQCDTAGRVISATSANLFVLTGGGWRTPPVVDCGIAGVCRQWILRHVADAREATVWPADIESAQALVLCNSVRGILPVAALGERRWDVAQPQVAALQRQLGAAHPAFDPSNPMPEAPEVA